MKKSEIICVLSIFCWFLMGSAHLNADVYTWTDEKGVRHFSNSPPSDARDPQVIFKEKEYDPNADQQRSDAEEKQLKILIDQIEADDRAAAEAAERRAEEARKNSQPSMDERVAEEQKRLQEEITDLQEKPLEYFGSYDNKRGRLRYYQNRLETLSRDPEKYFNDPESFRGVVKPNE